MKRRAKWIKTVGVANAHHVRESYGTLTKFKAAYEERRNGTIYQCLQCDVIARRLGITVAENQKQ